MTEQKINITTVQRKPMARAGLEGTVPELGGSVPDMVFIPKFRIRID